MASTGQGYLHPLPTIPDPVDLHFHYTIPKAFTLPLWMLWWTSMGEVVTSHESSPGDSVWAGIGCSPDHYLTHGIISSSLPLGVGSTGVWGGGGTSVLCLANAHTQGNTSL